MTPTKYSTGVVFAFASAIVLALSFALYTHHAWEDYYITFRASKNLATGHGLVFNHGDRLHTFTSPLGVLLPAVSYLLTGNSSDDAALWIFRVFSAIALGGAVVLLVSLAKRQSYPALAVFFLAALVVTDAKILDFSINGMETAFMMLFIAYAVWAHLTPGPRQATHLGAAWGGLMWTRPDSFLYIGLLGLGVWLFNSKERTGFSRLGLIGLYVRAGLIAAAIYLPWFLWAWWYYGSPVPHTIVAKNAVSGSQALGRLSEGWWRLPWLIWKGQTAVEGAFLPGYYMFPTWPAWMIPFGRAMGTVCSVLWLIPGLKTETRAASFAFYGGVAYLSFVPYFAFPWYYPTTTLLAFIALAGLISHLMTLARQPAQSVSKRWLLRLSSGAVVAVALLAGVSLTSGAARQSKAQQKFIETGNRRVIGEWLHEHAAPADTVFMEPLGYIGYFSGLKTFDWPGLSSREVPSAVKLVGPEWSKLIMYLQPTWLVLRSSNEGDLPAISPLLNSSNYEFVRKFDRNPDIKDLDIPGLTFLQFDAAFSLYRLKSPTRHDSDGAEVASPFGSGYREINGVHARTVHAPGIMVVPVPPKVRFVSGWYGFPPESYTGTPWTDGAEFRIYWVEGKNRELLLRRVLYPHDIMMDRNLQRYDVKLPQVPATASAHLVYETSTLGTPDYDWTSWTAPEFHP